MSAAPAVPRLSVWCTAQRTAVAQRTGRYLPESFAHPGKMLPGIAARTITTYTRPGDLMLDPMCGIGTTLVEAAHLGRRSIGVEYEPRWADIARANLKHAATQQAPGTGQVITGDARRLAELLPHTVRGRVALVLTSPPYGASVHGQVNAQPGGGVHKRDDQYSRDPANLAHQPHDALLAGFTMILRQCVAVVRPGGVVAITTRPFRQSGELVDLPGQVLAAGERAGLIPYERLVCLLVGLRGDRLVPRASFFQLDQVRKARRAGMPLHVIAHEDLLVFRTPTRPDVGHP